MINRWLCRNQRKIVENILQGCEMPIICGTIGCILSAFPILGGIVTLKRKLRGLALVGSLVGLFLIGPVFVSSILSLIGLILIVKSKKEFH